MDDPSQTLENESVEGEEASSEALQYVGSTTPSVWEICCELQGDMFFSCYLVDTVGYVRDVHKRWSLLPSVVGQSLVFGTEL